jgi:hypothetical protein
MKRKLISFVVLAASGTTFTAGAQAADTSPLALASKAAYEQRVERTEAFDPVAQVRTAEEAKSSVGPKAAAWYAKEFGTSESTATARLAAQSKVPNFKELVASRLGKAYGTVWFDNKTGQWVIGVVDSGASKNAAALADEVGLAADTRVETVPVSDDTLIERSASVAKQFSAVAEKAGLTLGVGPGRLNVTIGDDVDAETVRAIREAAAAPTKSGAAVPVRVMRASKSLLQPETKTYCAPWSEWNAYCSDIVAGTHIALASPGWQHECTAAFLGYLPSAPNPPRQLTAGHCMNSSYGQVWSCKAGGGGCPITGYKESWYWAGTIGDAGVTRLDSFPSTWLAVPGYINWSSGGISIVHTWEGSNSPVGQVVCKNGARTGSSCGTVTNSYAGFTEGGTGQWKAGMVETTMCSRSGDSGSPVTQAAYEAAAGILTHSNDCWAGGSASWYEPVSRAMANFGFQVLVA